MNGNFRGYFALSLALLLSSMIGSCAYLKGKKLDQTIKVTGSAKKRIKSDLMIWRTSIITEGPALADAYSKLARDIEKVKGFLIAQGFAEAQVIVSAVDTTAIRASQGRGEDGGPGIRGTVTGYHLKQSLEIRSSEIDKLTNVSRNVTQLIHQGILLESEKPQYLYTKLSETKVVILAEAARDARERALQIATSTGSKVGDLRSAEMGVLQITAADSNEVTGYGVNDTEALEKDVTAVVHVTFAVN